MISNSSSKKIVFFEFKDEVDAFLTYCKYHGFTPDDYHIIALQPEAQIYLKQLHIVYENTLPYFSNESHEKLLLKSEEWYQFLSKKINISDGSEIKETYNNTFLFFVRLIMNQFLLYSELLQSVIKKNDIDLILATVQSSAYVRESPLVTDDERYLGRMAKIIAKNNNISFQEIPMNFNNSKNGAIQFYGNRIRKKIFKIYADQLLNYLKNKNIILITTKGYNLGNVAEEIKEYIPGGKLLLPFPHGQSLMRDLLKLFLPLKIGNILHIPLDLYENTDSGIVRYVNVLRETFNATIKNIQNEWLKLFEYNNINFVDIFASKIAKGIKTKLLKLCCEAAAIRYILQNTNVKLIISQSARETALLIAELGNSCGIPRLMISHGTLARPKNKLENIECFHLGETLILSKFYNYIALQTPNEEQVFYHYRNENIAFKTGPLIFSKSNILKKSDYIKEIIGAVKPGMKIIIYPENTRVRYSTRFHDFQTFDEFLLSCVDLVNAMNEIDDILLIIRLHPGKKFTPEDLRSLLPESDKLTVTSYTYPFYKILTIADLLINFSSTVIEDALQNYIPVLLYDRWKRYMHLEAQILTNNNQKKLNGVYYINDSSYLSKGIQWIIDNHLRKNVPRSIFRNYVYEENYRKNLGKFLSKEVNIT